MKNYKKPELIYLDNTTEGIYMSSGDTEVESTERKCRFDRTEANPGSDKCQACSYSGGIRDTELPGESLFKENYTGCPDNMPEKN